MSETEKPHIIIAPSILNSDFAVLGDTANKIMKAGSDWLHMDVMFNTRHFVDNLTIGAPVVESLRKHTDAFLDCHLMVSNPEKWVKDFAKAGANQYTFHIEATENPQKLIETIKEHKMLPSIALRPKTAIDTIIPFLDHINMVLIMTVEPGFGGQGFMHDMMPKVEKLRKLKPGMHIQVDGGISPDTIDIAAKAGANVFVSGSAIFKHPAEKYAEVISKLRDSAKNSFGH